MVPRCGLDSSIGKPLRKPFQYRRTYRDAIRDLVEQRMLRILHTMPWAQRVREYLVREGQSGRTDMESTARRLGVSARTLRRRLAGEGTHYEEVFNDARCAIAKHSTPESASTTG